MFRSEPIAALRTLSTTLIDANGVLLPLATSWAAGRVKISRNGSAFVNATNLPVAVSAGGDGAFDLVLSQTEVSTLGTIRVRFLDADGNVIGEFTDEVEDRSGDFIQKDEEDTTARVLDVTLYGLDAQLLPADTAWSAGMVKVSKAGAAFVNTDALPVAVGGGDGTFQLQLSLAEVSTVGNLRVRFYASGGELVGETVAQVREAHALSGEASAHEAILQHWRDGWLTVQPSIPWTFTSEVFASEDEWARVAIVPALSRQSALGAVKRWTRSGTIGVQVFSPAGVGTLRVSQLADDVRTVLEGQFIAVRGTDQPVVTLGGSSGTPMTDGKWIMQLVTFAYSWDELRA